KRDFGAQSHGIGTRCLRFAGRIAPPPRKTRFRLLSKLCRAGFVHPQGCDERFPSFESLSPFSSLPDATLARASCWYALHAQARRERLKPNGATNRIPVGDTANEPGGNSLALRAGMRRMRKPGANDRTLPDLGRFLAALALILACPAVTSLA